MHDFVYFYPDGHQAHYEAGHPERPERIEAMVSGLEQIGLWQPYPKLPPLQVDESLLQRVHTADYLSHLQLACAQGSAIDADTYTTPASWKLALQAVGGGLAVAEEVWSRRSRSGMAFTRPPGHHATRTHGMGFCLLNNIAVAAEYLLHGLPPGVHRPERLAIVDLDLHHGNGTQDIFYDRPDVMFISTHQSPLYPFSGALEETGAGLGVGSTMNIPLPPATGDEGFLAVMDELILPQLDRYRPQMLLVSLGFDPHWNDPLGHLILSAEGFRLLLQRVDAWAGQNCQGRLALFIEGGYDLQAAAACAQASAAALLNKTWEDPLGPSPRKQGFSWRSVVEKAKQIWMF